MIMSRWVFLRMTYVSDEICRENNNTRFMIHNLFFRNLCYLWDNVEKYGGAKQTTDGNITRRRKDAGMQTHVHNI